MKKTLYIILFAALILIVQGCSKSGVGEDASSQGKGLKFLVNFDTLTKDSSGRIYFPDENNSGRIVFDDGLLYVLCIPIDSEGNPEYDKYSSQRIRLESNDVITTGLFGNTNKTAEEWFSASESGKCLFIGAIKGGSDMYSDSFIDYYDYVTYDGEGTPTYNYFEGWLLSQLTWTGQGLTSYMPKVIISPEQEDDQDTYIGNGNKKTNSSAIHIAGCTSGIVDLEDVVKNDIVTLEKFKPVTSILRFRVKMEAVEDGDLSLHFNSIKMSYEGTTRKITGVALFNFDGYEDGDFKIIDIPYINAQTEVDLFDYAIIKDDYNDDDPLNDQHFYPFSNYYDYLHLRIRGDKGYDSGIIATSEPSERWLMASVVPQTGFGAQNAYLVFDILDNSNNVIRTVKKKFPSGGFQSGKRYDFTLTIPQGNHSGAVDAGGYDMIDWE
ncbi:MAG: hypothetical protein IK045_00860 [Bacteroidales bacterium]|nr:hypothetical protein [Bacteroidales bacterium]